MKKFSKEKFSKLLSLRTFFQNFFHFQSQQKDTIFKDDKKGNQAEKFSMIPRYFLLSK